MTKEAKEISPDVSIIIPIRNGEKWINNCMNAIISQTALKHGLKLEIIIVNDGSTDNTIEVLDSWDSYFKKSNEIPFSVYELKTSKGVGAAKNVGFKYSKGEYVCFQDIDDVMHIDRILLQWEAAKLNHNAIVGSKVIRIPFDSTPRFVKWANCLTPSQLTLQIYTSNGPTLLMPTWFCHRSVVNKVGGFDESGYGTPEDLLFFYKHLDLGGDLHRVNLELLTYTYHKESATFSIPREIIWSIQIKRIEEKVLISWHHFTVWNAGKAGRRFIRALSVENRNKAISFCDVDKKKIGRIIELYSKKERKVIAKLPVVHFRDAKPPMIICVKLNFNNGAFEKNLSSLNLVEGRDYILFS